MFEQIKAYYKKLVPGITDSELTVLEQYLTIRNLKKGAFLVKQGQICNHVSFINSGLLRIYYAVDERDISIGFPGANDYTSEYESFLTRKPATQNIEVLLDAEVIDLDYEHMQQLYQQYACFQEFGRKIAELLFIMLNQRNSSLLALSPEERYKQMIHTGSMLLQQVPQYMLASYIGVTPEHLSRIRKKMIHS